MCCDAVDAVALEAALDGGDAPPLVDEAPAQVGLLGVHGARVLGGEVRSPPLLLHPGVPLGGGHDDEAAEHGGVAEAAVLGAEEIGSDPARRR